MTTIAEHQNVVIQHLLKEVADLQDRVIVLEAAFLNQSLNNMPEIIEIREIGREQAKAEITELFAETEGPLYFSDIEKQLGIDLELVVEICKELMDEGVIGIDADNTL